jgi:hypothetical protein
MGESYTIQCRDIDFAWPPPDKFSLEGRLFERVTMSAISDDERAKMTHVCRGAEYRDIGAAAS